MKRLNKFVICLIMFFAGNAFSQTDNNSYPDLNETNKFLNSGISIGETTTVADRKSISKKNSTDGAVTGAIIGAAAGVGIAAFLGSFSLEPSNDKKASFPALVLGGVFGGFIGAMVGDAIENE